MFDLYISDVDEDEVLAWLSENICPIGNTNKKEWNYFNTYIGVRKKWQLETADVSDLSSSPWDTITQVTFKSNEDALMCKLRWGGTLR